MEECEISKTVELGVPKVEEKCLQGDRCGECEIILTVEVRVGFSVDLTIDAKYVQSRFWNLAPPRFANGQAFRHRECSARNYQEHVVDGVSQFRWKIQKSKVAFAIFAESVKLVSMSPLEFWIKQTLLFSTTGLHNPSPDHCLQKTIGNGTSYFCYLVVLK